MQQVWIAMQGELDEGGNVFGVYLEESRALGDFIGKIRRIVDLRKPLDLIDCVEIGEKKLAVDRSKQTPSNFDFDVEVALRRQGAPYRVQVGCDWLSLVPHTVIGLDAETKSKARERLREAVSGVDEAASVDEAKEKEYAVMELVAAAKALLNI